MKESKYRTPKILMNNVEIVETDRYIFLRITSNQFLIWRDHIFILKSKLSKTIVWSFNNIYSYNVIKRLQYIFTENIYYWQCGSSSRYWQYCNSPCYLQ